MTVTAVACGGPDADDWELVVRERLACGLCKEVLTRGPTTLGGLRAAVEQHIGNAHIATHRGPSFDVTIGERTFGARQQIHRIARHTWDTPSVWELDLVAHKVVLCAHGACHDRLAHAHTSVRQLADRIPEHMRVKHSGLKTPTQLRREMGIVTETLELPSRCPPRWPS